MSESESVWLWAGHRGLYSQCSLMLQDTNNRLLFSFSSDSMNWTTWLIQPRPSAKIRADEVSYLNESEESCSSIGIARLARYKPSNACWTERVDWRLKKRKEPSSANYSGRQVQLECFSYSIVSFDIEYISIDITFLSIHSYWFDSNLINWYTCVADTEERKKEENVRAREFPVSRRAAVYHL